MPIGHGMQPKGKRLIDFQFFGLVDGMEKELGYFNLSELESIRGKFGLPVERDMYLGDKTLNDFKD